MLWSNVFLGYFIWATYYYNLNYGVSNKVWQKIEEAKSAKASSLPYNADILDDEPLFNPYNDQTFGLPPGTVRGMIAFSLLFGGTALLIVSFGLNSEISPDSIFRDQYEFFKTAFLMMVAFYFGTRSLKYLNGAEKGVEQYNTVNAQKKGTPPSSTPKKESETSSKTEEEDQTSEVKEAVEDLTSQLQSKVVVIDGSDPLGKKNLKPGTKPPISAIDPMA